MRLVQLKAARRPTAASRHSTSEHRVRHPAAWIASRLVQLKAARRPTAASCHSTSERRVLRSSPLRRGPWPSCCVKSVATGSAQSCTSAHSRLASLQLGASRVAQRRCVAALGRPAACMASRLVQLKAARQTKAASRHPTSECRVLRSSPQPPRITPPRSVACCAALLRRGPWPSRCVHSIAPGSAQSCTADHSRLASLHLGAPRAAQLAAALWPLAVPLRKERRAWFKISWPIAGDCCRLCEQSGHCLLQWSQISWPVAGDCCRLCDQSSHCLLQWPQISRPVAGDCCRLCEQSGHCLLQWPQISRPVAGDCCRICEQSGHRLVQWP